MIVVDTSVWVDHFNARETRETGLLRQLLPREMLAMGDLILIELLQGARSERDAKRMLDNLDALELYAMGGYDVAVRSARNYRQLRARGVTVRKTIDLIIATFCVEHGHTLLHSDRDFDLMREPLGLVTL